MTQPGVSIVVESYNHGEGSELERLLLALRAATALVERHGAGEVLLTDSSGDAGLPALLARELPSVRLVDATGLDYDTAKIKAANEAANEFVLYLDGDCLPNDTWVAGHLDVLRSADDVGASAGFTRYDDGYLASILSVLDFGFLLPRTRRGVGCYAFNNAGFRREVFLENPPPPGPMRCRCYPHSQLLRRRGKRVVLAPGAVNRHEVKPFLDERFRQGYDTVAAARVDQSLPERRFMRLGPLAAAPLYLRALAYDWLRLARGRRDVGLTPLGAAVAVPLVPVLRLVDLAGMVFALTARDRAERALSR